MGKEARRNKGTRAARRLAATPFEPEQLKAILEAGNSDTLTEFVGFKCLHNPKGAVASLETYLQHRRGGCRPFRAAATYDELTGVKRPIPEPETGLEDAGAPE